MPISMAGLDLSGIQWNHSPPLSPPGRGDDAGEIDSKRSDLPCPRITLDRTEYRSMHDGSMITSRAAHREHLRRNGLVELGNDRVDVKAVRRERDRKRRASLKDDLMQAVKDYREGKRVLEKPLDAAKAGFTAPIAGTARANVPVERPQIIV